MHTKLKLGDIAVNLVRKEIKNVHLSVHPPTGRVTISAPGHLSLDTIRVFAISKLPWIRKQQKRILEQERETPREFIDRESHYVWGQRYLLMIMEGNDAPTVELIHGRMIVRTRPGWDQASRQDLIEAWYRNQIRIAVRPLIEKWEPLMRVKVARVFVRRMKTRWGSCNPRARTIRLNTDLAKRPSACLEYIVVHEMIHFHERQHDKKFIAQMENFLPQWRSIKDDLTRFPLRNENWEH